MKRTHQEVMFYDVIIDCSGKLFKLSAERGYDSEHFIKTFMYSDYAERAYTSFGWSHLNFDFYTLQMEIVEDDYGVIKGGDVWDEELMYWIGYLYRYWYFYNGDSAKTIYDTAPPSKLRLLYPSLMNEDYIYIIKTLKGEKPWQPPKFEEDWG